MQSKGFFALLSAVSVVSLVSTAQAVNLLSNSGFETPAGTTNDSIVNGWNKIGDITRAIYYNHTSGGNHSIWLKTWMPIGGGIEQTVDVVGGASYNFSAQTWFESSYPNTVAITRFSLTWLDASSAPVGTPFVYDILPSSLLPGIDTGAWIQQAFTTSAPANAAKVTVFAGWEDGGSVTGAQSAFVDDIILDGPGTAPVNAWGVNGAGDWNINANWTEGSAPNAIGASANFLGVLTAPHTVYSDTEVTVGSIKFNNASTYVLAGAGSLKIDVASGTGAVDVLAGSHKINLPLTLNDSTVATVAAGGTLTIADPLTLVGGSTLTKSGAGNLEIISTTSTTGSATLLTAAGKTSLRLATSTGLTLASSGGETDIYASQNVAAVNITGGLVKIDAAGAAKTIKTAALTVGAGQLDITDNGLIVNFSGASPIEAIRTAIVSGAAGGNGILSSANLLGTAVGYANANEIGSPASFLGTAVGGNAVLVRLALKGDCNLSGSVDFDDLLSLAQNYGLSARRWVHGDSSHDGLVNFDDLLALAQNYNSTLSLSEAGVLTSIGGGDFAADWALAASLVPEPASILSIGSLLAFGRRRR